MTLSIKKKIELSFLALVLLFIINGIYTIVSLKKYEKLSNHFSEVIDPSLQSLYDFRKLLQQSKMFSTNWVFLRYAQADKDSLIQIHASVYPELKNKLTGLSKGWNDQNMADSLKNICESFGQLMVVEKEIMNSLKNFDDYDDPANKLQAEFLIEDQVIPRTTIMTNTLSKIMSYEHETSDMEEKKLQESFRFLTSFITFLAIDIVCIAILLSFYLTKIILNPINKMRKIVVDLSKGIIKKESNPVTNDEIGEMVLSVNNLSDKLSAVAAFANKVGNREFDAYFEPLSEKDVLGKAVLSMRDNLKRSEKKLVETNSEMQTFFQNIDKVFFSIDMISHKLLQMSPACEKVYGYAALSFSLNTNLFYDLILEEDKAIIQKNNLLMSAGKTFTHEYRIRHKDKSTRWVETDITATLDKDGKLVRVDGVTSDITQRREAEEALKTNIAELKKTNNELDKFVYSVSHDLRAPLSSMFGVIQISEEETQEPLILEHLGMLKGSIKKLDGFISDILNYSRNSRVEVKKEEIDFKKMLDSISDNLKFMGNKNRKVDIKMDIHNKAPFYSDLSRVSIVLNNLISNAIRYQNPKAENPFVAIKVDTSDTETNIIIKDNGIGIVKEMHEKIFEMFYRVSESSVGSGLGLYIVKETLNKLNGNIEIESELGQGTTFTIHLPNLMSLN